MNLWRDALSSRLKERVVMPVPSLVGTALPQLFLSMVPLQSCSAELRFHGSHDDVLPLFLR